MRRAANFFAHAVSFHFLVTSAAANAWECQRESFGGATFATGLEPAECPILILKSVRARLRKLMAWRLTPVEGPSMRAFKDQLLALRPTNPVLIHNVNDDGQLAIVRPSIDQNNAANLNESAVHPKNYKEFNFGAKQRKKTTFERSALLLHFN